MFVFAKNELEEMRGVYFAGYKNYGVWEFPELERKTGTTYSFRLFYVRLKNLAESDRAQKAWLFSWWGQDFVRGSDWEDLEIYHKDVYRWLENLVCEETQQRVKDIRWYDLSQSTADNFWKGDRYNDNEFHVVEDKWWDEEAQYAR